MNDDDELKNLNREADGIDDNARRDFARRVAAARSLRARCTPWKVVMELEPLPEPALVLGLSQLARRILALVAYCVTGGAAGVQAGLWDLVWRYRMSLSSVRRARDELVAKGWLVVTPDYVPAEETKLLGPYISASGNHRSLRAEDPDDPDAHQQSQVRNLYTLTSKAKATLLLATGVSTGVPTGVSNPETCTSEPCEQLGGQTPDTPDEQATSGFLSAAVSGSDSGSASPDRRRPCGFVDNPSVAGPEIEGSAPSSRSTLRQPEDDRVSQPSAARVADTPSPPVAVETLALVDDGAGDARGIDGESPRRGLFGALGWRVSRFFRGGEP